MLTKDRQTLQIAFMRGRLARHNGALRAPPGDIPRNYIEDWFAGYDDEGVRIRCGAAEPPILAGPCLEQEMIRWPFQLKPRRMQN